MDGTYEIRTVDINPPTHGHSNNNAPTFVLPCYSRTDVRTKLRGLGKKIEKHYIHLYSLYLPVCSGVATRTWIDEVQWSIGPRSPIVLRLIFSKCIAYNCASKKIINSYNVYYQYLLFCSPDSFTFKRSMASAASFASCRLLFIRDDHLILPNYVGFIREELETFINAICTNQIFSSNLQFCTIVIVFFTFMCASCTIS